MGDVYITAKDTFMEVAEYQKMYDLEQNNWWWVGRRIILASLLKELTTSASKILDVGCGTGMNLRLLNAYGDVTGLDISAFALDCCRKRGFNHVVVGDIEKLPFENNVFDIITALDVLEHVDVPKALAEMYRVLKPRGYNVITVPAFQFLWSGHDQALGHKQRYNAKQMKRLLGACGFKIVKISYWNTFLFPFIAAIRLIKFRTQGKTELRSDNFEFGPIINGLLSTILKMEAKIIPHVNLPFGVSLVCIARKC
jgi:ubiquinone/menaquinone biosynthesis C-methylase UbiE